MRWQQEDSGHSCWLQGVGATCEQQGDASRAQGDLEPTASKETGLNSTTT